MNNLVEQSLASLQRTWRESTAEQKEALLDSFALEYAFNSGKIENDAITLHDTREVFEHGRVIAYTGDVRTLFEIQNLKESWDWACLKVEEGFRLDEQLVLQAHELLTRGTYDERRYATGERPGTYKVNDYVVGANDVGASADEAGELTRELLDEVEGHRSTAAGNELTIAAYLHAKLVEIHPFADGNGRVARLLMNMVLLAADHPPIAIREQDRMAYYGALDTFHEDVDLSAFKEFLAVEALETWRQLLP